MTTMIPQRTAGQPKTIKRIALFVVAAALCAAPLAASAKAPAAAPPKPAGSSAAAGSTAAAGSKTVAVISIESYDDLLGDVAFVGKISNNPGLDKNLEGMLKLFTQGRGVAGLDRQRPWGVVLTIDNMEMKPFAFLPVTSLKQLLGSLAAVLGEPREKNGVLEIDAKNQTLYLKEQGGWAFIAQTPESLASLPKDPLKLLGGLEKQYDVAVRVNVKNIPEMYRDLAIDQLKAAMQGSFDKKEGEADDEFEARKQVLEQQLENNLMLINETDQLTLGWSLDQKSNSTYVDFNVIPSPGTTFAKRVGLMRDDSSAFAGFASTTAAASANYVIASSPTDIKQGENIIKYLRALSASKIDKDTHLPDDEARTTAKGIVNDVLGAVSTSIKSGKMDGGVTLSLDAKSPNLVAGGYLADPSSIDKAVRKFAKLVQGNKDYTVKFNTGTLGGATFHTLTFPVQDDDAAKVLGDKLSVQIGIGKQAVYVAAGPGGMEKLKAAMGKSATAVSTPVPPFKLVVGLGSLLSFASQTDPNPMLALMAQQLAKSNGADHVTVTLKPAKMGVTYHLVAEEGVLQLIGQASRMAGGGAGSVRPVQ